MMNTINLLVLALLLNVSLTVAYPFAAGHCNEGTLDDQVGSGHPHGTGGGDTTNGNFKVMIDGTQLEWNKVLTFNAGQDYTVRVEREAGNSGPLYFRGLLFRLSTAGEDVGGAFTVDSGYTDNFQLHP